jgi:mannose-6-phosphate isomerase-like protein (cupin superfamily)
MTPCYENSETATPDIRLDVMRHQQLEVHMKLAIAISLTLFSFRCPAQSSAKVEVFPVAQINGQFAQLAQQAKANGSSGSTLGDYGSHALKLNERTASGGAEIHAHFDDVILVTEGTATLITGGEVIDPHAGNNGETTGSGIRKGTAQPISAGDLVHIPAGTPHQLLIAPGTSYSALVIKVRE